MIFASKKEQTPQLSSKFLKYEWKTLSYQSYSYNSPLMKMVHCTECFMGIISFNPDNKCTC